MHLKPIYIEQELAVTMTDLLRHMQEADKQSAWDRRLASIHYLPDVQEGIDDETERRHFTFTTRLGFGHTVSGEGVCTTTYNELKESVTSDVVLNSAETTALIASASGYQKARPTAEGVRFSTSFDYSVRLGWLGKLYNLLVLRPYIKWATAYSFDALRMWLRHGVHPRQSWRRTRLQALFYLMMVLCIGAATLYPQHAFTSLSALFVVATAAWINSADLPRARNCSRKRG